jgi:hypothetical protein
MVNEDSRWFSQVGFIQPHEHSQIYTYIFNSHILMRPQKGAFFVLPISLIMTSFQHPSFGQQRNFVIKKFRIK